MFPVGLEKLSFASVSTLFRMDHVPLIAYIAFIFLVHCHTARCFNFAVNKSAYQSSTLTYNNFIWTADKAVDGNTDGRDPVSSRTCSSTELRWDNHTWEVDIGVLIIVKTIMVYERSDGNDQLSGFNVFIGNATKPWTANQPLIEVQPINTRHTFRVHDSLARFVSVIRQNNNILVICEVVVDGECQKGTFGDGCNGICGHCLNGNDSCNSTTGHCVQGCERGWSGITCKEECQKGTFGDGCIETCGNCLNGNISCNGTTGHCIAGCQRGWSGITCKDECNNGTYGRECAEICGNCLKGTSSCSKIDGKCIDGCECGWRGETCKIDSSEKQMESYPAVNAPAIGGSVGGICVIAIIVNIITVAVLKKRLNKDTRDNEMQMGKVNHDMASHYVNLASSNTGNVIQSVNGGDNAGEGFQTGYTEYEKLQDRGRIEGSAYCAINYIETDESNENSGEGFGIETGVGMNSDVKTLRSVERELKALDKRKNDLIRQKEEIQTRLRTTQTITN